MLQKIFVSEISFIAHATVKAPYLRVLFYGVYGWVIKVLFLGHTTETPELL